MLQPPSRRACIVLLSSAAIAGTAGSAASAATLTPAQPCMRYVSSLAGQQWVPVSGTGFTPNTDPAVSTMELRYSNGDLGGFAPLAGDGSFGTNLFMPTEFIPSSAGRVKTYTLMATDRQTPGLTASVPISFVRAGLEAKPSNVRGNVGRKVRWSAYGAPTRAEVWAHWTFRGRSLARRKLGTAKGACGIVHKRMPFLPARPLVGTWTVYITPRKRFSRKQALLGVEIRVSRAIHRAGRGGA
jgi:hypothetical protein